MKRRLFLCLGILLCLCAVAYGVMSIGRNTGDESVVITLIDTGLSTRAIPSENILEGKNYLDPSLSTKDTYGHGTAVASVILDILPDAKLVPLVSNAYEDGKILQVDNEVFAQIIRDAVDVYQCQIINISIGLMKDVPSIREAVAYAEEKGVLIVASAGNDYAINGEVMYYPACYETVLAVGSLTSDGTEISDFSQRGEWVDVYAVGEEVSTLTLSGNTDKSKGTSYSTAKITAYAGKVLSESKRKLTVKKLRQLMIEND